MSTDKPNLLQQSYNSVKNYVHDSINVIQDGMQALKDEFVGFYDKTANCLSRMASPVNNFIKDFPQIDAEFQAELSKDAAFLRPRPNVVPLEQAMSGYMEENY